MCARVFDQGCDSTRKTSDPLTVNGAAQPTVIICRGMRKGKSHTIAKANYGVAATRDPLKLFNPTGQT